MARSKRESRAYNLMKLYGITLDQYDKLLKAQDERCAICDRHESEFKIALAVDHDHVTDEIRGLLCNHCNHRLVGRHRDGAILRKIAEYVEQGTGLFIPQKIKRRRRARKKNSLA